MADWHACPSAFSGRVGVTCEILTAGDLVSLTFQRGYGNCGARMHAGKDIRCQAIPQLHTRADS
jgi:hypothetical protein